MIEAEEVCAVELRGSESKELPFLCAPSAGTSGCRTVPAAEPGVADADPLSAAADARLSHFLRTKL